MALIELRKVSYELHGVPVLKDADLELEAGERVVIHQGEHPLGEVLVRLLSGLERPASGRVLLLGVEVSGAGPSELGEVRSRAGFVSAESVLISNLKVAENVALPLLYHTGLDYDAAMKKAMELLRRVGYAEDPWALPGHLPARLKKAVVVARALALEPQVMVVSDLRDGLGGESFTRLAEVITEYQGSGEGRLAVFVTGTGAEAPVVRPGRVIRVESKGFVE